jgi:thioredoxin-dependent peroxiredoxin
MRRWLVAIVTFLAGATTGAHAEDLAVGGRAPAFALPGSDGRTHRLSDLLGRRGVVLAWFPKAFTPG